MVKCSNINASIDVTLSPLLDSQESNYVTK
jgi:hypothetical protein